MKHAFAFGHTAQDLQHQHHALDLELRRIERRGLRMTPSERARAQELKKLKLAAKDRLASLR
jgi:uncharacterized protein YdcH (DUF465 family)